jgi:hypothetical protein
MSAKEYREYRKYAAESLEWARTARTDQERDILIQIAKTWLNAALIEEGRFGQAAKEPQEHRTD